MNFSIYNWLVTIMLFCFSSVYSQTSEWTDIETKGSMSQELTIIGNQIYLCVKSGFPNEIVPNIDYKLCVYEIKLNEHGNLDFQPIEFITLFTPSDSSY